MKHRAIRSSAAGIAGCLYQRMHFGFDYDWPGPCRALIHHYASDNFESIAGPPTNISLQVS